MCAAVGMPNPATFARGKLNLWISCSTLGDSHLTVQGVEEVQFCIVAVEGLAPLHGQASRAGGEGNVVPDCSSLLGRFLDVILERLVIYVLTGPVRVDPGFQILPKLHGPLCRDGRGEELIALARLVLKSILLTVHQLKHLCHPLKGLNSPARHEMES